MIFYKIFNHLVHSVSGRSKLRSSGVAHRLLFNEFKRVNWVKRTLHVLQESQLKNIYCLLFGMTILCLVACGQKNTSSAPLTPTAPVSLSAEKIPDVVNTQELPPPQRDPLEALKNNHNVPLLIIVTGDPGNTDLDVVSQKLHEIDVKGSLDQDLGRDRTFTAPPSITVSSYLITVNSTERYQKVVDCTYRFPKLKMLIIPFTTVKLISYLNITYFQPLTPFFKERTPENIWIGNSPTLPIANDFSDLNLEDPAVIAGVMSNCRDFDRFCFGTLLKQGYFANKTVVGGKLSNPLETMSADIHKSAVLIASGKITGDAKFPDSLLNNTYAESVIKDMTLTHELWVMGEPKPQDPMPLLLKVQGADDHTIVLKSQDGGYLFRLPIQISSSDIPIRTREDIPSMSRFLSEMEQEIESNAGVIGL